MKVRSRYLLVVFSLVQVLWLWLATGCDACCPTLEGPTCNCFQNGARGRVCDMGGPYTKHYDNLGCPYYSGPGCCNCEPDGGDINCYCSEYDLSYGWFSECPMGIGTHETIPIAGIWGSSPDNFYVIFPDGRAFNFDGGQWNTLPAVEDTLNAIWGFGQDDLFVVGEHGAWRFQGGEWVQIYSGLRLLDVWGSDSSNVFLVGGDLYRFDGSSVSLVDEFHQAMDLRTISGTGQDNVVVGGHSYQEGIVYQYDGTDWKRLFAPKDGVDALSTCAPDNVYAVTSSGRLYHFNGMSMTSPYQGNDYLWDVWCGGADNVYIAGNILIHFDGEQWKDQHIVTGDRGLRLVWGLDTGDIYTTPGVCSMLYHFRPE